MSRTERIKSILSKIKKGGAEALSLYSRYKHAMRGTEYDEEREKVLKERRERKYKKAKPIPESRNKKVKV